jgi:hypothetical protein
MRLRCTATLAVLSCGLVCSAQGDGRYVSKEGGFAARFPAGADVTTKTVPAPGGLKAVVTTAVVKAKQQTYIVTYTVHQKGVLKAPAKTILDLGEKATLSQPQTLRLEVKNLAVGKEKYPAREILTDRDGNQTRTRFIAADPVLYTLVVGGPKEFASGDEATDFLDTFEIVPPGKAKTKK